MILQPLENISESRKKIFRLNEFFLGKKLREQNSRNPNCRGKKYLAGGEFYIKSYVGNTPPKSSFFDDGTSKYM